MNINKLIIENFRGYYKRTEINFNDLTAFVGKNDAGKSWSSKPKRAKSELQTHN